LLSAKECVKTHLTNAIAFKINGAESVYKHINGLFNNKTNYVC